MANSRVNAHRSLVVAKARGGTAAQVAARLQGDPRVESVVPDAVGRATDWPDDAGSSPTDELWDEWQADMRLIGMPSAWSITTGSEDVVVAILDTGYERTHEDLESVPLDEPSQHPHRHEERHRRLRPRDARRGHDRRGHEQRAGRREHGARRHAHAGEGPRRERPGLLERLPRRRRLGGRPRRRHHQHEPRELPQRHARSRSGSRRSPPPGRPATMVIAAAGNNNNSTPFYPASFANVAVRVGHDQRGRQGVASAASGRTSTSRRRATSSPPPTATTSTTR